MTGPVVSALATAIDENLANAVPANQGNSHRAVHYGTCGFLATHLYIFWWGNFHTQDNEHSDIRIYDRDLLGWRIGADGRRKIFSQWSGLQQQGVCRGPPDFAPRHHLERVPSSPMCRCGCERSWAFLAQDGSRAPHRSVVWRSQSPRHASRRPTESPRERSDAATKAGCRTARSAGQFKFGGSIGQAGLMLDTRDRDPLRPEHSSCGAPRAICVTARGVLLDARFYCALTISLVAHIDATCAPAIVRMDATQLVAILAVWRGSVAAIRVIGVVVVVIPERTAKIGEPATIATAVIVPAAAITVPIRVAVVALPFAGA